MFSTLPSLFAYTDYDSTVILKDSGNTLLASIMGEEELDRIDRLPETDPANVSLRQAEDMKWAHVNMTVDDAADLLVYGSSPSSSAPAIQPVEIDPGFSAFHEFCKTNLIPMVIISIGIQPLIESMLDRYLGANHGILVRANGLEFEEDGSWRVLWRDSSPFGLEKGSAMRDARKNDLFCANLDQILWCGDGTSDFPAALEADIVLARESTSLERLCRNNNVQHIVFSTFETVTDAAQDWIRRHPVSLTKETKERYESKKRSLHHHG